MAGRFKMYQNALRTDQARSLSRFKQRRRLLMARFAQEAIDTYLARFQGELSEEIDHRPPLANTNSS